MRTVYVNGEYVAEADARVSVFDRGFLFADAVYEVTAVIDGRLIDFEHHMARLRRSLDELEIAAPADARVLLDMHRELVARNGIDQGLVYLQVSRGAADRDFFYPPAGTPPTLVAFTQRKSFLDNLALARGIRVVSQPDLRWKRCDIKTVQLLYAAMAKMQARAADADDAWLVKDGHVNEGASTNVWIVDAHGALVTPALSHSLLPGITRAAVMRYAQQTGRTVREAPFTITQAQQAQEAFVTSATSLVQPVTHIDNVAVGGGEPGPVARQLLDIYVEESRRRAI